METEWSPHFYFNSVFLYLANTMSGFNQAKINFKWTPVALLEPCTNNSLGGKLVLFITVSETDINLCTLPLSLVDII